MSEGCAQRSCVDSHALTVCDGGASASATVGSQPDGLRHGQVAVGSMPDTLAGITSI